jgi:hypothetical protein
MKYRRICRLCGDIFYCIGSCKDLSEGYQLEKENVCRCLYCTLKKKRKEKGRDLTKEEFFLFLGRCCDLRKKKIIENPSYWKPKT